MSNDKTYDRHVNIWINGKEVKNDISSIKKEMFNLTNEVGRATLGSDEYNKKAAELKKVKTILKEHQENIAATGSSWTKVKDLFKGAWGVIGAGAAGIVGAYQAIKGVLTSTGDLSDKLDITLAGWKSGVDALKRSIATLDFKNFTTNIKDAIDEGRRYAANLDEIDDKTRALLVAEAKAKNDLIEKKKIQNDVNNSLKERNAAGKEIIRIEEDLAAIRTGIADQAFANELKNITAIAFGANNVNERTKEQIKLYLERDKAFLESLEPAEEYIRIQNEINRLTQEQYQTQMSTFGPATVKVRDNSKEILELQKEITLEQRDAYELKTQLMIPTDEKYNALTEKWVGLEDARASASEKTMKVFTKNAGIENQIADNHHDQEVIAEKENQEFIDREIKRMEDEAEKKKKIEEKSAEDHRAQEVIAEKENQDFIDSEIKRMEDEADKKKDIQKKADEELLQLKQDFVLGIIGLGETLFDRQLAQLDAQYKADIKNAGDDAEAKKKIEEDYNREKIKIQRKAAIAEKAAAIFSIAVDTAKGVVKAIVGIVTAPLVPWIIANGAIQAAIVAARPLPQFYGGGFSGHGDKYEPKGVVHSDEWIANAAMVASPVTGPIIQALEQYRVNSLPGYVNGGMAEGTGQRAQGTGQSALVATDPKLTAIMEMVYRLLVKLDQQGVKNIWPWSEIDNMRKGMDKLEDIEGSVS